MVLNTLILGLLAEPGFKLCRQDASPPDLSASALCYLVSAIFKFAVEAEIS